MQNNPEKKAILPNLSKQNIPTYSAHGAILFNSVF